MCGDEYNGWSNRETWATALWINTEWLQPAALEIVASYEKRYDAICVLEDMLEEITRSGMVDGVPYKDVVVMVRDIGSFWRIHWGEIYDSLVEE